MCGVFISVSVKFRGDVISIGRTQFISCKRSLYKNMWTIFIIFITFDFLLHNITRGSSILEKRNIKDRFDGRDDLVELVKKQKDFIDQIVNNESGDRRFQIDYNEADACR